MSVKIFSFFCVSILFGTMSLNATHGYVIEQELHDERTIDTMTCHGRAREEFQLIEKQRFKEFRRNISPGLRFDDRASTFGNRDFLSDITSISKDQIPHLPKARDVIALFTLTDLWNNFLSTYKKLQEERTVHTLTCHGSAREEFSHLLEKQNIKEIMDIFSPNLRVEKDEESIKVYFNCRSGIFLSEMTNISKEQLYRDTPHRLKTGDLMKSVTLTDLLVHILPDDFSLTYYTFWVPQVVSFMPEIQDRNKATLMHVLNFGSPIVYYMYDHFFDPQSYLEHNPDIAEASRAASKPLVFAIDHYYRRGVQEKRPFIPRTFDEGTYLRLNQDVCDAANQTEDPLKFAREHYLNHGRHDAGRRCTVPFYGFSADNYFDYNRDVEEELYKQPFCTVSSDGKSRSVDSKLYVDFAINHYKRYGYFQGRQY